MRLVRKRAEKHGQMKDHLIANEEMQLSDKESVGQEGGVYRLQMLLSRMWVKCLLERSGGVRSASLGA